MLLERSYWNLSVHSLVDTPFWPDQTSNFDRKSILLSQEAHGEREINETSPRGTRKIQIVALNTTGSQSQTNICMPRLLPAKLCDAV